MDNKPSLSEVDSIKARLMNDWQRVLFRLWVAKLYEQHFWLANGVDSSIIRGWLPIYALCGSMLGGSAGAERLRLDVRGKHGFPFVESVVNGRVVPYRIHIWDLYGEKKRTPIYRLACDLTIEDWEEIFSINSSYVYYKPVKTLEKSILAPIQIKTESNNQMTICVGG